MPGEQEDFRNQALAQLLSQQGIEAKYEQRSGRKRIDVVTEVDGLRVLLEAETGFNRKAQAIKDADARLLQSLATIVFAVCYPEGATADTLADATLTWTVRTKAGEPAGAWTEGQIAQLAQAVRQAPSAQSGADVAARLLSDELDRVVQRLKEPTRRALAKALDLPPTKPKDKSQRPRYFVPAKRGMLVVATAMLFHHRVHGHLPSDRPSSYDGPWPPASASSCYEQDAVISAYREAWRGIVAVDYRPVFETARAALDSLPTDPDIAQAVRSLAIVIGRISEEVAGLRHDLLGRIFHRVLDTAKYDGSYYTSTAAAVLLASLALREQDANWADPSEISGWRICDPACGTGTLLMAAAERIRDLHSAAGPVSASDEETLSLCMVEDILWGFDSNLTATHMAASTLGMLSPAVGFNRMNIHRTTLGLFNGNPYLGSLDFLAGQARMADWPSTVEQVETEQALIEAPKPMDMVIMNPPFTRDSLRHDQFGAAEEKAIKAREKEVLGLEPSLLGQTELGTPGIARAAARLHSSGGAFTVLADRLLKANSGTLALVLPSVVPTAPGNLALRRYLAQRFHVDTIVSSHDPDRIYFSESTKIGEVLLICRRWDSDLPKPPTRVVNLAKNPATPLEALDTATRIEGTTQSGIQTSRDLTMQQVDAGRIAKGDWLAVNFLSPYLVQAHRSLIEGSPASVPVVRLSTLAAVGPGGQRDPGRL